MLKPFPLFLVAVCLSFAFLAPDVAMAQSRQDFKEMEDNIEKLTKQMRAVQRRVFQGGELEAPVPTADDAGLRQILADMEARFGVLDRQVREMNGKFEELEHRQGKMEEQLALFRRDMDLRFQDVGGVSPAPSESVDESVTPPVQDAVQVVGGAEVTSLEEPEGDAPKDDAAINAAAVDPHREYGEAFSFVRKGDFLAAEGALKAFLADHADHELAGNAQYWLGETYYARKDYPRAAAAFLSGFQTYGKGTKGPDSLLKLGLSLFGMGKKEEACSALAELPVVYPKASDDLKKRAVRELERIGCN